MPPAFVFEPNRGQAEPQIRYLGRGAATSVAFPDGGVLFRRSPGAQPLELRFAGRNPDAHWEPLDPLPTSTSYFLGKDPEHWIAGVPHSRRLIQRGIYPGIDLVFYGKDGRLEFDFLVSAHADPRQIRLGWFGAARHAITAAGDLEVEDETGARLVCAKPSIYQERESRRVLVTGRWVAGASPHEARFALGAYDRSLPLTIDPVIDTAAYIGGESADRITASDGVVHAGVTESASLWQWTPRRGRDVFVTTGSGSVSIYGGSGDEEPTAIAGGVVVGWTSSADFPVQSNASQPVFGGGKTDAFVISANNVYNPVGTYLGGSGDDRAFAVAAVNGGGFFVAGETTSPDFPVRNALQPTRGGGADGFLTRFTAAAQIAESTYWGGSGEDAILGVAANEMACWFAGRTTSTDLSLAAPVQPNLAGGTDAFLARANIAGTATTVEFSSYYGGSGDDEIRAIRIAPDGWIWVAGNTTSADLPLVRAAQDRLAGATDGWAARLDPRSNAIAAATYFGGSGRDEVTTAAADANGELHIAGWTDSPDLPVRDAIQERNAGGEDGFFARLDTNGMPRSVSYVGGSGKDRVHAIVTPAAGTIVIAGETDSADMAALEGKIGAGGTDGWTVKLHEDGIYATDVLVGKDLTTTAPFQAVVEGGASAVALTVRSTDPAKVLVNGSAFSTSDRFVITGLASQGEVELILSSPGLTQRRVRAVLAPSFLISPLKAPLSLELDEAVELKKQFGVKDPDTGEMLLQEPRPGIEPALELRSADADIVRTLGLLLRGWANGSTTVSLVSPLFPIDGPREGVVTVGRRRTPVVRIPDTAVGNLLWTKLSLTVNDARAVPFEVRLTSEEPSKLLLGANPTAPASESVTVRFTGEPAFTWVKGLASSGVVRVRAEVEGAEPVFGNIALAPSIASLSTPAETPYYAWPNTVVTHNPVVTSVTVEGWSTKPFFGIVLGIDGLPPTGFTVGKQIPDAAARFRTVSSDTSVLISWPAVVYPMGEDPPPAAAFSVITGTPGTASLRLESDIYKTAPPLTVTVLPPIVPLAEKEITLGKNLQRVTRFPFVSDFPADKEITITSSDPSRVLVSLYGIDEAGSMKTRIGSGQGQFQIVALADSGDVPVLIKAAGFADAKLTVHLRPTRFGFSAPNATVAIGELVPVRVTWEYDGQPTGYAEIAIRSSLRYTFAVSVSNGNVLRNDTPTVTFGGYYSDGTVIAINEGVSELHLRSTSEAIVDPSRATSVITVKPRKFGFYSKGISLGKDLETLLPGAGMSTSTVMQQPVTLRSLDPTKLLLSTDPALPGSESVPGSERVWVQALADSGDAYIVANAPGYYDAVLKVRLYPTALGFEMPRSGYITQDQSLAAPGDAVSLRIVPYLFDPDSGNLSTFQNLSFRGGLDPFEVKLRSTNAGAGRLNSPVAFMGGMSENTTVFRAESKGSTDIEVEPPAGFADASALTRRHIEVGAPAMRFCRASFALGKDMQMGSCTQASRPPVDSRLPVIITSSDPSRVLISSVPERPGSASATIYGSPNSFYVQALAADGEVTITASAPGYETGSATVRLEPSFFAWHPDFISTSTYADTVTVNSVYRRTVHLAHPSDGNSSSTGLRPGMDAIEIPVELSDPAVLSLRSPVILRPPAAWAMAEFTVNAPGDMQLSIGAPAGFPLAPERDRTVTVKSRLRSFGLYAMRVGEDRAARTSVTGYSGAPDVPTTVRLVSSDPSRVLLARDLNLAGTPALDIDTGPGGRDTTFYVYGLAASGTAQIALSGPGYEPQSVAVELQPSGFQFSSYNTSTVRAGQTGQARISSGEPLRGGMPRRPVEIENSNPAAVEFSPVNFGPGDSYQDLTIKAKAPGTAVLTIRNAAPSSGTSAVFVVTVVP